MTPRQRMAAAAVALMAALVVAGGWLALSRDGGVALWSDGAAPDSTATDANAGTETGSGPAGSGRSGGDQAGSASSAPPRVHAFAEQPGKAPAGPLPSPTAGQPLSEGIAGCDFAYGDGAICVPWQFPDGVTDKCGWLKERDFEPFPVHGRDRHGLDRNRDGTACGPGD
ncbi:hypothetical protein WEI85_43895 [Actinomycetes bacterium KLBMP 9797]